MITLLKTYNKIFVELAALNSKLDSLYKQIEVSKMEYSQELSNAKNSLREKLEENTQRTAKVNAFKEIAKTHSTKHIPAISAKPFDSSVLSKLSVQINSGNVNDSYAVQLYTEATAQLIFLNLEIAEITQKNEQYIERLLIKYNTDIRETENKISIVKAEILSYLNSNFFSSFISCIKNDTITFNNNNDTTEHFIDTNGTISLGTVELPFPIPRGMESDFAKKIADLCNVAKAIIKVPVNISINHNRVILAEYTNTTENLILKGVQNIILNIARYYGQEFSQVSFIDPIRYNSSSLGCLSRVCGDGFFIDNVPHSEELVRKKIANIVSNINPKRHIETSDKKVYIFHDFPQSYDTKSIGLIQQLCANAEYYGINVILTHNQSARQQADSNSYQFIRNIALNISVDNYDAFFCENKNGNKHLFEWYVAPLHLPSDIEKKYVHERPVIDLNNNYIRRVGLDIIPRTKKGVRKLDNIPYGIDNNGNILYLDFENTNFATYICGASRSGKSTLIHTIITGILQSTHPDNVEIWLVDFGKTEFSRYVNKNIPHIRYIILDESPELVYDLVDRLTEIMLSRQNKFMGKWEKLKDVPEEQYMPELFVVIDEFSIMSNVLANSVTLAKEDYRIKLQTILAKGAKLGMRFIFSSQGFTEGTRGLTEMAKDQIQQRIAMKADYNDIKSTLDLKTISERDELLMEQLPVHYALRRIPLTEQGDRLNNAHVLYIPCANDQFPLFENLKECFSPEKVYDPSKFGSYIYKRPMFKDGNTFEKFNEQKNVILDQLGKAANNDGAFSIYIGSPQRMLQVYPIEMVNGFCENGLIISPTREKITSASLIISATESLKLQNFQSECWTPNRNSVYRQITNDCNYSFDKSFVMIEDICERISQLKYAIEKKIEANIVIFIMNYETIMMDMQYLAEESTSKEKVDLGILSEYGSITRDEGEMDLNTLLDLELESDNIPQIKSSVTVQVSAKVVASTATSKAYDARNDLIYILTHGPRYGYHFIMQFDTCGDFRQTKLDESLFRHKIMFQTAKNEAIGIVNSAFAQSVSTLSNHIFRYTNGIDDVSFRPYLHPGICIDGWSMQGQNIDNIVDEEDYLE